MKAPIIVNEGPYPFSSGDVSFYDSVDEACRDMEPVDVADKRYFIFDAEGMRLDANTDGRKIWLTPTTEVNKEGLVGLVVEYLTRVHTEKAKKEVAGYLAKLTE